MRMSRCQANPARAESAADGHLAARDAFLLASTIAAGGSEGLGLLSAPAAIAANPGSVRGFTSIDEEAGPCSAACSMIGADPDVNFGAMASRNGIGRPIAPIPGTTRAPTIVNATSRTRRAGCRHILTAKPPRARTIRPPAAACTRKSQADICQDMALLLDGLSAVRILLSRNANHLSPSPLGTIYGLFSRTSSISWVAPSVRVNDVDVFDV